MHSHSFPGQTSTKPSSLNSCHPACHTPFASATPLPRLHSRRTAILASATSLTTPSACMQHTTLSFRLGHASSGHAISLHVAHYARVGYATLGHASTRNPTLEHVFPHFNRFVIQFGHLPRLPHTRVSSSSTRTRGRHIVLAYVTSLTSSHTSLPRAHTSLPLGDGHTSIPSLPLEHRRTNASSLPLGHRHTSASSLSHRHSRTSAPSLSHRHGHISTSLLPRGHGRISTPSLPHGHGLISTPSLPHRVVGYRNVFVIDHTHILSHTVITDEAVLACHIVVYFPTHHACRCCTDFPTRSIFTLARSHTSCRTRRLPPAPLTSRQHHGHRRQHHGDRHSPLTSRKRHVTIVVIRLDHTPANHRVVRLGTTQAHHHRLTDMITHMQQYVVGLALMRATITSSDLVTHTRTIRCLTTMVTSSPSLSHGHGHQHTTVASQTWFRQGTITASWIRLPTGSRANFNTVSLPLTRCTRRPRLAPKGPLAGSRPLPGRVEHKPRRMQVQLAGLLALSDPCTLVARCQNHGHAPRTSRQHRMPPKS